MGFVRSRNKGICSFRLFHLQHIAFKMILGINIQMKDGIWEPERLFRSGRHHFHWHFIGQNSITWPHQLQGRLGRSLTNCVLGGNRNDFSEQLVSFCHSLPFYFYLSLPFPSHPTSPMVRQINLFPASCCIWLKIINIFVCCTFFSIRFWWLPHKI